MAHAQHHPFVIREQVTFQSVRGNVRRHAISFAAGAGLALVAVGVTEMISNAPLWSQVALADVRVAEAAVAAAGVPGLSMPTGLPVIRDMAEAFFAEKRAAPAEELPPQF